MLCILGAITRAAVVLGSLFFACRLHLKNLKPASVELTVVLRRTFQLMYDGYFVDAFAAAAL